MTKPKAGLITLYAQLYDEADAQAKDVFKPFTDEIEAGLVSNGLDIMTVPVCVYEADIQKAVHYFEEQAVDALIILFLAYHPSLASAEVLAATDLPLIMLDTTVCHEFDETTEPAMISLCHGIHGVQDLCCVLRRLYKDYIIEAGHYKNGDVLTRTAEAVRACQAAKHMQNARVGLIGSQFKDMGDFAIPFSELEAKIGLQVVPLDIKAVDKYKAAYSEKDKLEYTNQVRNNYRIGSDVSSDLISQAAQNDFIIKQWIAEDSLTAFSFNFLSFAEDIGLPAIPFVSASDLMADKIGYAGEGDVLTAALCSALFKICDQTTFTEMFCPDWAGNRVFLSHMGEANHLLLAKAEFIKKDVSYVPELNGGVNPGVAGLLKAGSAILVNLAPGPDNEYTLILVPCQIEEPERADNFPESIRGWLKPQLPLEQLLEEYSLLGGTHHSCLCYGASIKPMLYLADLMGWQVAVLE